MTVSLDLLITVLFLDWTIQLLDVRIDKRRVYIKHYLHRSSFWFCACVFLICFLISDILAFHSGATSLEVML